MSLNKQLLDNKKELIETNKKSSELFNTNVKTYDINSSNIKFTRIRKKADNKYNELVIKELKSISEYSKKTNDSLGEMLFKLGLISAGIFLAIKNIDKIKDLNIKSKDKIIEASDIAADKILSYIDTSIGVFQYEGTDTKTRIKNKIIQEAKRQGVDPALALAMAQQESGFNPKAKSSAGAMGVFQLMPSTAKGLGVTDPWNEDQNIQGGITYLKQQLDAFGGDTAKALAAYNAGPGNVKKYGGIPPFKETQNYVKNILANYPKYQKELNNLKKQEEGQLTKVKPTSSGSFKKFDNNTSINGYIMANPSEDRKYIELSERAERYLRETEGKGIVTSGSEGLHALGTVSHKSGNKIDIQGLKGSSTTNQEYAELCINFLKNPETAYVNLESFSEYDVEYIVNYIKNKDVEAYELANTYTPYTPGSKTWFGKYKLLCSIKTKYNKHLDIAIKPNAYTKKEEEKKKDNYNVSNKNTTTATINTSQAYNPKKDNKKQNTSSKVIAVPVNAGKEQNNTRIIKDKFYNDIYRNTLSASDKYKKMATL